MTAQAAPDDDRQLRPTNSGATVEALYVSSDRPSVGPGIRPEQGASHGRDARGRMLPGYSANPAGRPKSRPFVEAIRKALAEPGDLGETRLHDVVLALIRVAVGGDVPAIRELLDRVDGKVVLPIAGDTDAPLRILVVAHPHGSTVHHVDVDSRAVTALVDDTGSGAGASKP